MVTFVVCILLVISIYYALRSMKKQKGCGGGCAHCSQVSCPAKTIQKLASERKKKE